LRTTCTALFTGGEPTPEEPVITRIALTNKENNSE